MTPTQWPITHQWTTQPVGANTGPYCPIEFSFGANYVGFCSDSHKYAEALVSEE